MMTDILETPFVALREEPADRRPTRTALTGLASIALAVVLLATSTGNAASMLPVVTVLHAEAKPPRQAEKRCSCISASAPHTIYPVENPLRKP
jgi:hypothetical protein